MDMITSIDDAGSSQKSLRQFAVWRCAACYAVPHHRRRSQHDDDTVAIQNVEYFKQSVIQLVSQIIELRLA